METPKICVQSSWKDNQNSKSRIPECLWPMQVAAPSLILASLWLVSRLESPILMMSPFCALLESHHITCQGISAPPTFSGKGKPPLPPWSIPSLENRSLKGHQRKPSSHAQRLAASVLSPCVSWARNGLKPSGQQQKQRSWTSFHANDLSVASCSFTVLLSARALGPSKPGARF